MSKKKRIHWKVRGRQSCGRKIDRYRHCNLGFCSFEQVSRCWRTYTYVCTQNVECSRVVSVKGWRRAAHRAAAAAGMRITSSSNGRAPLVPRFAEREPRKKVPGMPRYLDKRVKSRGQLSTERLFPIYPLCRFQIRISVKVARAMTRSPKILRDLSLLFY